MLLQGKGERERCGWQRWQRQGQWECCAGRHRCTSHDPPSLTVCLKGVKELECLQLRRSPCQALTSPGFTRALQWCAAASASSPLLVSMEASWAGRLTFAIDAAGAVAPEGKREGSEEGCTSLEHPKPLRASEGRLVSRTGSCFGGKEYANFTGPQGIINAAQMAQAASALQQSVQQSGLGPYFMQQTYPSHMSQAQLQQVLQASYSICLTAT